MSYVVGTTEAIAPYVKAGQLVVLESTTYPGTTDEVMRPILEAGGSNLALTSTSRIRLSAKTQVIRSMRQRPFPK